MKKSILFVFALMIAVIFISACSDIPDAKPENTYVRFECVYENMEQGDQIFVDSETGVMYYYHLYSKGAGLVVMVDEDGKPLIWEGE